MTERARRVLQHHRRYGTRRTLDRALAELRAIRSRRNAWAATRLAAQERIGPDPTYHHYYRRSLPDHDETQRLVAWARSTADLPSIELLVIDGADADLRTTLVSIARQRYPSLACTVLTDASALEAAQSVLDDLASDTDTIAWTVTADRAAALPTGMGGSRLVGFLEAGEVLGPAALLTLVAEGVSSGTRLVYSDHDAVEPTGRHVRPWFIPDWSPDRSLGQDYVGGFYLARDESLHALTHELAGAHEAWRYELLLRLADDGSGIAHVPRVLWSRPADAVTSAGRAQQESATVENTLRRCGMPDAQVETVSGGHEVPIRRISWPLPATPRVSVVVHTTGRPDLVQGTLMALTELTSYPDLELIFLDDSRGRHPDGIDLLRAASVTVLEHDEPITRAKANNDGARAASGDLLLFLDDDLEVIRTDWLTELVRLAARPDVGVVGPMLLEPDGTIQHAGFVVVGDGDRAVHLLQEMDPDEPIYLDLQRIARDVSAVSGACLLVRRSTFEEVGGFDEELAAVGIDIDLCLRIARSGRRTLWTPHSRLVHRESSSRSRVDHMPDEGHMSSRWSAAFPAGDPYHNPNLAQDRADLAIDWQRVADRRDPIDDADPASGVNLVGFIRAEMGVGEATRAEAQALTDAEIPFVVIDVTTGNPARMRDLSWSHKVVDEPVFAVNILHLNADVLSSALAHLPDGLRRGRRNIGYWIWELPEFPRRWQAAFDLVDEVWVPTRFVQDGIGTRASKPVRVVPLAVRRARGPFLDRAAFGLPTETYQFLAMYDTQSVMERKNPTGAIEAFKQAFAPDDSTVSLVVKVNSPGDPELKALSRLAGAHANIRIVGRVLSRDETDSLIACSDAFISLHRSEGFGFPIAEAMAVGKPVIATAWSGNMDFMSEETAACVGYRLVTLERDYGPYDKGQRWAEPDVDDAAAWMRRLRDDPELGRRMGQRAAASIAATNSSWRVGTLITEALALPSPAGRSGS